MGGDSDDSSWKQVRRVQKLWAEVADRHDVDPDDWIYLADALDALGYRICKKKKNKGPITRGFFGIVEE